MIGGGSETAVAELDFLGREGVGVKVARGRDTIELRKGRWRTRDKHHECGEDEQHSALVGAEARHRE